MQELRAQAKAAGVPVSEIRSAESAEELQGLIAGAGGQTRKGKTMVAKKKVVKKTAKTVAKAPVKRGRPKGSTNKAAPAKRGRPKGSVNKTTTRKAVKSTNGRVRNVVSTEGRHILDGIDYSDTDGWNPRKGSAPDVILNALRRFKGNREKVFEYLKGDVWNFVGKKMQDGSKRTLSSAHDMLRYRIARTDWDYALKTGQHEKSTKRIVYGTGENATTFKRAKKSTAKKAPAKRGRPAKAQATTGKRRGRPPGSKNKTTAVARKAPAKRTMKRK
jgi:hypothetical protein